MTLIHSIQYFEARVPLTQPFKHNAAERTVTETIIISVTDTEGTIGYGEGCPRSYVTGESLTTAIEFYGKCHSAVLQLKSIEDIQQYVIDNEKNIDANPAAWCALELALLDLFARSNKITIEALLHQPETPYQETLREVYQYSAVIGDSSPETFNTHYRIFRQQGFNDFKIKLSNNLARDIDKLKSIRNDLAQIRIRADANNLWHSKNEAFDYLQKLDVPFEALEEPLQAHQFDELKALSMEINTPIILDESFLRFEHIHVLLERPSCWRVNARVSKLGGLLRSFKIIEALRKEGISIIVGAQVGETSLLSRAALALADAAGPSLIAQEGAFGTHLLQVDPFAPMVQFGMKGELFSKDLQCKQGFGLGLNPLVPLAQDPMMVQLLYHLK